MPSPANTAACPAAMFCLGASTEMPPPGSFCSREGAALEERCLLGGSVEEEEDRRHSGTATETTRNSQQVRQTAAATTQSDKSQSVACSYDNFTGLELRPNMLCQRYHNTAMAPPLLMLPYRA